MQDKDTAYAQHLIDHSLADVTKAQHRLRDLAKYLDDGDFPTTTATLRKVATALETQADKLVQLHLD